jgi:hypothetical protein
MQGVLMKNLPLRIVVIGFLTLAFTPILIPQDSSPCTEAAVPTPVREVLRSKFALWRPKQVSDIDEDNRQFWLKGPNAKACPGIAVGHFESSVSLSYALLLVPKSDPNGGHKLVVFSKEQANDTYAWKLLDHAEGETYSGLVISKAEPGKYEDLDGKPVHIRLDALYVEWMEKGAQLYYWAGGRYHKLEVSD